MPKLWPLLSHCKYFYEMCFVIMLYTEDFSMHHYGFSQIKSHNYIVIDNIGVFFTAFKMIALLEYIYVL